MPEDSEEVEHGVQPDIDSSTITYKENSVDELIEASATTKETEDNDKTISYLFSKQEEETLLIKRVFF